MKVWSGHSCPLPLTLLLILTSVVDLAPLPLSLRHPERSRSSGGARDLARTTNSSTIAPLRMYFRV